MWFFFLVKVRRKQRLVKCEMFWNLVIESRFCNDDSSNEHLTLTLGLSLYNSDGDVHEGEHMGAKFISDKRKLAFGHFFRVGSGHVRFWHTQACV